MEDQKNMQPSIAVLIAMVQLIGNLVDKRIIPNHKMNIRYKYFVVLLNLLKPKNLQNLLPRITEFLGSSKNRFLCTKKYHLDLQLPSCDEYIESMMILPPHAIWWYNLGKCKGYSIPGVHDIIAFQSSLHSEFIQRPYIEAIRSICGILGTHELQKNNALTHWSTEVTIFSQYLRWNCHINRRLYGKLMVVYQAHNDLLIALFVLTNIIATDVQTKSCRNLAPPQHSMFFKHVNACLSIHKNANRYKFRNKRIDTKNTNVAKALTICCVEFMHKYMLLNVLLTNHIESEFGKTMFSIVHLTTPKKMVECNEWVEKLTKETSGSNAFRIKPHALKRLHILKDHMIEARRNCQQKINVVENKTMHFGEFQVNIKNGQSYIANNRSEK